MSEPSIGANSGSNGDTKPIAHLSPPALPELCARVNQKVEAFLNTEGGNERVKGVQAQCRLSLQVIEEALQRYSLGNLSISYNGGKDCLVLLILYLSALHAHYSKPASSTTAANHTPRDPSQLPRTLRSVYIVSKHPFQEVDDFVDDSVNYYHLSLSRHTGPMREAFADYLSEIPPVKAIFVGTRRTDPHGEDLGHFNTTDRGWPEFMRIHPVIDWHYVEIWTFIRELEIPYCRLYDLGYTSLGGTTDTHPNPALKRANEDGQGGMDGFEGGFRPAYELVEDQAERLGRAR